MMRLRVTIQTRKGAEAFTRRAYNIPKDHGIGWTPYRYLVTRASCAHSAFYTAKDFRAWTRAKGLRLVLEPHNRRGLAQHDHAERVIRSGYLVPTEFCRCDNQSDHRLQFRRGNCHA